MAHVSRSEDWRMLLSLSEVMGYSVGAWVALLKLLVSSISPMRSSTKSQPSRSCHVLPVNMEMDHPRVFLSQPLGEERCPGRQKGRRMKTLHSVSSCLVYPGLSLLDLGCESNIKYPWLEKTQNPSRFVLFIIFFSFSEAALIDHTSGSSVLKEAHCLW